MKSRNYNPICRTFLVVFTLLLSAIGDIHALGIPIFTYSKNDTCTAFNSTLTIITVDGNSSYIDSYVDSYVTALGLHNGTDGVNGTNGIDGINGTNGIDGRNGTDVNYTYANNTYVNVIGDTMTGNLGLNYNNPNRPLIINTYNNNISSTSFKGNFSAYNQYTGFSLGNMLYTYDKIGIFLEQTATYGRGKLHFAINNLGSASNVTLSDTKMTISEIGNVGIGTTSPVLTLDIAGGFKIAGSSAILCNTTNAGAIYYNSTTYKHYGCNSTSWNALY